MWTLCCPCSTSEEREFFGVAGRMALTNYVLQVAVLDVLASLYGASLRVRPLISVGRTAVVLR